MKKKGIIVFISWLIICSNLSAQNLDKVGKKGMLKINGGVNFNSLFYGANGIANRRDPFTWYLNGNITLSFLDWSIPFSYSYSNNQAKFTQPFNQVSLSPTYKWVKAYIGYTSMNFSQYTLAGHIFLGGGFELTPKNWKIAAMYGQLKKAVAYDLVTLSDADMSYSRMGYGAKIAYENNGYGLGITYFSAKDDPNSIPYIPGNTQITPMENTVIGFQGKAKISKYFTIDAEYALSGLTRNILVDDAQNADASQNKLPYIFNNRSTSQFFQAYRSTLDFNLGIVKVGLNYEHVDPDYKTLGAYYFNNDFENITVSPAIALLKGKLSIALNTGFQRNNLDKTKFSSTQRWVGSANVNFAPSSKWNFNLGYSNFSSFTNVRPQTDPFYIKSPADTLNYYQLSQNANATVSHNFGKGKTKQALVLTANYQVTGQRSGSTEGLPTKVYNGNLAYSLNFSKTKTSLSLGINANQMESFIASSLYAGPNITIGQGFLNNTMRTSAGVAYNWGYANNQTNSSVINSRISIGYNPKLKNKILGKPSLSLGLVYTQRFKTIIQANEFNEFTGTLTLAHSF